MATTGKQIEAEAKASMERLLRDYAELKPMELAWIVLNSALNSHPTISVTRVQAVHRGIKAALEETTR
jgi:hypothetical protein